MGAREQGLRVTAVVPDHVGELAALTSAVAEAGGSFISFGQYSGDETDTRTVTFKVTGIGEEELRKSLEPMVARVTDVRS
jgi:hypothetical protein